MTEKEIKELFENKNDFNTDNTWVLMLLTLLLLDDNKKEEPTIRIYIGSDK